jgi:hypothetical protein
LLGLPLAHFLICTAIGQQAPFAVDGRKDKNQKEKLFSLCDATLLTMGGKIKTKKRKEKKKAPCTKVVVSGHQFPKSACSCETMLICYICIAMPPHVSNEHALGRNTDTPFSAFVQQTFAVALPLIIETSK